MNISNHLFYPFQGLQVGSFTIYYSWMAKLVGAIVGLTVFIRYLVSQTLPLLDASFVSAVTYLSGLVVGVLTHAILTEGSLGIHFYGLLLGGFIGLYLCSRFYKFSFKRCADYLAPWGVLVYSIARISCYLKGCCGGNICFLPWATINIVGNPVHPVQLYDSFLNFLLFLLIFELKDKFRRVGECALVAVLLNSCIRFFMEYFRWGVSAIVVKGVITQNQIINLILILSSLFFLRRLGHEEQHEEHQDNCKKGLVLS